MQVTFASTAGSLARPNEDFVAASPIAVVVLDGLSAPAELGTGCIHSTPWYVAHLGGLLVHLATSRVHESLIDVTAEAIRQVATLHDQSCDLMHPGTPSASVSLVRVGVREVEYLALFDSVIVFDGPGFREIITDLRVDAFAQSEDRATKAQRIGTSEHQRAVSSLVVAQRRHRNQPDGYWVAGSLPEAASMALTGSFARDQVVRMALLTDGASCLVDSYGLSRWDEVFDVLDRSGPREIVKRVRTAEQADPDGARWPRYKSSDDATIAYCRLTKLA